MIKKSELKIGRMNSVACSVKLTQAISKLEGIENINVNFSKSNAHIEYDDSKLSIKTILEEVEALGYNALVKTKTTIDELDIRFIKRTLLASFIISTPLFLALLTTIFHNSQFPILNNAYFQLALATPLQFIIGFIFYRNSFYTIKSKFLGIDTLLSLSTTAAYFLSLYNILITHDFSHLYFEVSATLITIGLLGKYLDSLAKGKSAETIKKLLSLQPKTSCVIINSEETEVEIENIEKGNTILINPGDKIPVDGIVIEGSSSVDESMITGESAPVDKSKGSTIIGGTKNLSGSFKYRAIKVGNETFVAQIIKTIENTRFSKTYLHGLEDNLLTYYIPSIISLSMLTFMYFYFIQHSTNIALTNALSVLITACPSALVLATPIAIMLGIKKGLDIGIIIKNGESLERLQEIDTFVFDKNGTLTNGQPELTDILTVGSLTKSEAIKMAAIAEKESEHPLGMVLYNYAREQLGELPFPEKYELFPGMGIKAVVGNKQVILGTPKFAEKLGIILYCCERQISHLESEGKTPLVLCVSDSVEAVFGFADSIREEAVNTISILKNANFEVFMITGDTQKTSQVIGEKIGITNIIAEVLPKDKPYWINQIKSEGKKVAMVGDGISDALSLTASDTGIAIGSGVDLPVETGDIVLLKGNLASLLTAIRLSKITTSTIKQSLFWASIFNIICIPLAIIGILNPLFAAITITLSLLSVLANSLLLKLFK